MFHSKPRLISDRYYAFSSAVKWTKQILRCFPIFHFIKNVKHVRDRKFIKVHICQKLSKIDRGLTTLLHMI